MFILRFIRRIGRGIKTLIIIAATVVITCIVLHGCGEDNITTMEPDEAVLTFKASVESFCDEVAGLNDQINAIDSSTEGSHTELLSLLDRMQTAFDDFSKVELPEAYRYLSDIPDKAAEYMDTAVSSYHELLDSGETPTANLADYAAENYSRACKRVHVLLKALRGEDIDDAGVSVTFESSESGDSSSPSSVE